MLYYKLCDSLHTHTYIYERLYVINYEIKVNIYVKIIHRIPRKMIKALNYLSSMNLQKSILYNDILILKYRLLRNINFSVNIQYLHYSVTLKSIRVEIKNDFTAQYMF